MTGRPYPTDPAERRQARRDERDAAVARARDGYLVPFASMKCAGDVHANMPNGCANDGVTCLCDCHDDRAATPRPEETLRAAAARLRELATKATDGPWRWNGAQVDVEPTTRGTYIIGDGQQEDDVVTPEDGAWIAALNPAVAEPLARELERHAIEIDMWRTDTVGYLAAVRIAEHALAFAHSILDQQ